jgi:hypothetical protein
MSPYQLAKFLYAIFRIIFVYSIDSNKLDNISRNCVKRAFATFEIRDNVLLSAKF